MELNAPLLKAIKEYRNNDVCTFHMPGHRFGKGIPEEFLNYPFDFDVTEVPGTDNLHNPEGPIEEARGLAARLFGALDTYFLVNGSTAGIHAMILAACKPGDKLLVPRNCHQSVIGGMMLAGAEPVYIKPGFIEALGIPGGVSPNKIESVLKSNIDAVGALITSPSYYGFCSDLKAISEVLHSSGKALLVDEAHGAHFVFSRQLPCPSLLAGADACVQSTHKTLPAVTSSALLHIGSGRVKVKRIENILEIIQTSSPSYITMVSIDAARALLEKAGDRLFTSLIENCSRFREKINQSGVLYCPGKEITKDLEGEVSDTDLIRLVINVEGTGKTGYETEYILRNKYNIQIEMSDLFNIVCIPSIADEADKFDRLRLALEKIALETGSSEEECTAGAASRKMSKTEIKHWCRDLMIPPAAASLKDVLYMESEKVDIMEAKGRISSGRITPYPPGIPAVCPGEIIEPQMIDYLLHIRESGGKVFGLDIEGKIDAVKE